MPINSTTSERVPPHSTHRNQTNRSRPGPQRCSTREPPLRNVSTHLINFLWRRRPQPKEGDTHAVVRIYKLVCLCKGVDYYTIGISLPSTPSYWFNTNAQARIWPTPGRAGGVHGGRWDEFEYNYTRTHTHICSVLSKAVFLMCVAVGCPDTNTLTNALAFLRNPYLMMINVRLCGCLV